MTKSDPKDHGYKGAFLMSTTSKPCAPPHPQKTVHLSPSYRLLCLLPYLRQGFKECRYEPAYDVSSDLLGLQLRTLCRKSLGLGPTTGLHTSHGSTRSYSCAVRMLAHSTRRAFCLPCKPTISTQLVLKFRTSNRFSTVERWSTEKSNTAIWDVFMMITDALLLRNACAQLPKSVWNPPRSTFLASTETPEQAKALNPEVLKHKSLMPTLQPLRKSN